MLRHAGMSEIYTKAERGKTSIPFRPKEPAFRYITCAMFLLVSSPSPFIAPAPSARAPPAAELYSDLYF